MAEPIEDTNKEPEESLSLDDAAAAAEEQLADEPEATEEQTEQETEEPVTESTSEPEVPAIVTKHNPGMAGIWTKLTRVQRSKLLEDIATNLDSRQASQASTDGDEQGANGAESRQDTTAGQGREFVPPQVPQPLDTAHIDTLIGYFGEDSPEGKAMQALIDQQQQVVAYNGQVAQTMHGALNEVQGNVEAVRFERSIEQALVDHNDQIGDVTPAQHQAIASQAYDALLKGEVASADDAVLLAAIKARNGKPQQTSAVKGDKTRRSRQAASYDTASRQATPQRQDVPQNLDEAWEQAEAEMNAGK